MAQKKRKTSRPTKRASKSAPGGKQVPGELASKMVKKMAAKQKIAINLTEEQFAELMRNFKPKGGRFNPKVPFQIDFRCGTLGKARLPVASCAYWSDTCCA